MASLWSAPKFFYHPKPDGTLVAVDSDGVPLVAQPLITRVIEQGSEVVRDAWGNEITEYQVPTGYLCHVDPVSGARVAVDEEGVPLPSQPPFNVVVDQTGTEVVFAADGSNYQPPPFYPPPGEEPEIWPPEESPPSDIPEGDEEPIVEEDAESPAFSEDLLTTGARVDGYAARRIIGIGTCTCGSNGLRGPGDGESRCRGRS